MSKVMLVMDEPKTCADCPCLTELSTDFCYITDEDVSPYGKRPDSCPLRPVPEKKKVMLNMCDNVYYLNKGYNACIDEILKE